MPFSERELRVVIPARFGSQRLHGKPLVDLAGKPMIVRVFHAVEAGLAGKDIVVAVDDARVLDVLEYYGVPGLMSDPDCASGTDRVAEIARLRGWGPKDVIVNVQGDEPLIPADLLQAFAQFCMTEPEFAMATVAVPMSEAYEISDPNVVKVTVRQDGVAMAFSRSAIPFDRDRTPANWYPSNYRRHLGIYGYRNDVLQRLTSTPPCEIESIERLEQLRALWLGIPIHVMDWDVAPPGGVDTAADVQRVVGFLSRTQT